MKYMNIDESEYTKQNVIVNKKTCLGLDPYYNSSIAKQSIDYYRTFPFKSSNTSNDKLTLQKQLSKC